MKIQDEGKKFRKRATLSGIRTPNTMEPRQSALTTEPAGQLSRHELKSTVYTIQDNKVQECSHSRLMKFCIIFRSRGSFFTCGHIKRMSDKHSGINQWNLTKGHSACGLMVNNSQTTHTPASTS